jgi:hypothetical protein
MMNLNTVTTVVTLILGTGFAVAAAEVQTLEQHYLAARAALAKGNNHKAKRKLKRSLQYNPLHGQSHFLPASLPSPRTNRVTPMTWPGPGYSNFKL